MSQSLKTLKEFGSVSVKSEIRAKLGSTSALTAASTPAPVTLADAAVTLTVDDLDSGLLVQTPTATRLITLPSAVLTKEFLKSVGDSFDFHVINNGADSFHMTFVAGTGGSIVGLEVVKDKFVTSDTASGSAHFRIRQTNVTSGTEAYVVYRLA